MVEPSPLPTCTHTHTHTPPSPSILFYSDLRLTKEWARVGLDRINHHRLGVALWRARTVFGYGVHNRYHWWYVVLCSPHPIPSFLSPPPCFPILHVLRKGCLHFWKSLAQIFIRVRIICARVWHFGDTPSPKSCPSVKCTFGGNMCPVGVSAFSEPSSPVIISIRLISRICICESVRRSQLDSPLAARVPIVSTRKRLHPIVSACRGFCSTSDCMIGCLLRCFGLELARLWLVCTRTCFRITVDHGFTTQRLHHLLQISERKKKIVKIPNACFTLWTFPSRTRGVRLSLQRKGWIFRQARNCSIARLSHAALASDVTRVPIATKHLCHLQSASGNGV